jgi:hypothetical protein
MAASEMNTAKGRSEHPLNAGCSAAHRWQMVRSEFKLAGLPIREDDDSSGTATFGAADTKNGELQKCQHFRLNATAGQ